MIPSIMCYLPPSVELLEPTTPQISNQIYSSANHISSELNPSVAFIV